MANNKLHFLLLAVMACVCVCVAGLWLLDYRASYTVNGELNPGKPSLIINTCTQREIKGWPEWELVSKAQAAHYMGDLTGADIYYVIGWREVNPLIKLIGNLISPNSEKAGVRGSGQCYVRVFKKGGKMIFVAMDLIDSSIIYSAVFPMDAGIEARIAVCCAAISRKQ